MSLFDPDTRVLHVHNSRPSDTPSSSYGPLHRDYCRPALDAISRWPGYQVTPLVALEGLARHANIGALYYKDESSRFGLGSFKALGGAYAVSVILMKHLAEHLGRAVTLEDLTSGQYRSFTQDLTVTCATDGNHGRSVAWGAERFGCRCIIYIHRDVSHGREQAIARYGADIVRIEGNYDASVRQAASDAESKGRIVVSDTSYPGYLDIPGDVMRGYTVLADEALDQLNGQFPTHVFLQGGVGGFAAAIAARVRDRCGQQQPRIVVVEPDQAACIYESVLNGEPTAITGNLDTIMAGLACGEVSLVAFDVLRALMDDVLVVPDSSAVVCMRELADGVDGDSPIVAGESGVAGLAGLLLSRERAELSKTLDLNNASRVLVIGTEGATDPEVYERLVGRSADEVLAA